MSGSLRVPLSFASTLGFIVVTLLQLKAAPAALLFPSVDGVVAAVLHSPPATHPNPNPALCSSPLHVYSGLTNVLHVLIFTFCTSCLLVNLTRACRNACSGETCCFSQLDQKYSAHKANSRPVTHKLRCFTWFACTCTRTDYTHIPEEKLFTVMFTHHHDSQHTNTSSVTITTSPLASPSRHNRSHPS